MTMSDPLMMDLQMSAAQFGMLASAFLLAYSILQIPAGILLDHISVKKVLIHASLLCSVGCFLFALTNSYYIALLARFIMGCGSAFAVLSTFKLISVWFEPRHFMTLTGVMCTFGTLGFAFGQAAVHLLSYISWQYVILGWGAIGVIICFIIVLALKLPDHSITNVKPLTLDQVTEDLYNIIRHRHIWVILIYGLLIYAPFLTLTNSWSVKFIENTLRITKEQSTYISMLAPYGFAIGAPLLSYISDRQGKRKPMLIFSALSGSIILSLILSHIVDSVWTYRVLFLSFGFCIAGFLPSFSVIKELTPPERTATSLGLMNTFNSLGGVILGPFVGLMIQQNIASHVARPYATALYILPVCVICGLFFAIYSRETNCKQVT